MKSIQVSDRFPNSDNYNVLPDYDKVQSLDDNFLLPDWFFERILDMHREGVSESDPEALTVLINNGYSNTSINLGVPESDPPDYTPPLFVAVRDSRYILFGMGKQADRHFGWYLDITPNQMFSFDGYPIEGKRGFPLCKKHGKQLEVKEVVIFDREATDASPPDYCWVCE